jgi:hypothetical protein
VSRWLAAGEMLPSALWLESQLRICGGHCAIVFTDMLSPRNIRPQIAELKGYANRLTNWMGRVAFRRSPLLSEPDSALPRHRA